MIERVLMNWKPLRGTRVLEREAEQAAALIHERRVKAAVKARDGRCRWPEKHKCRGGLECAHVVDASLGGSMSTENLVLLCSWTHRRGPESIHGKQLKITHESPDGIDPPWFAFWKQDHYGEYYLVARETAPFQYERD